MDITHRRRLFEQRLTEGLDHKTILSGIETAIDRLAEACRIAAETPRLEEPLLEIANYRLAHAKLRIARSADDFHEIHRILANAVRPRGHLSIMPRILQLAVHHRLACFAPEEEREDAKEAMEHVWATIIESVGQAASDDYRKPYTQANSLLQSVPISMAELAAYFTGCDLLAFDGIAPRQHLEDMFRGLSDELPYVVCANDDPHLRVDRRIPRDIAVEMVEQRLDRDMADIGFVIDRNGGYGILRGGAKFATQKNVLVLGFVMGILTQSQVAAPLGNGTLTTYRKRINVTLKQAGVAGEAIRFDRRNQYSFEPGLRVVGAVSRELLGCRTLDDEWGRQVI